MLHSLSAETLMIVVQSKRGFFDGMNGVFHSPCELDMQSHPWMMHLKGSYHDKSKFP